MSEENQNILIDWLAKNPSEKVWVCDGKDPKCCDSPTCVSNGGECQLTRNRDHILAEVITSDQFVSGITILDIWETFKKLYPDKAERAVFYKAVKDDSRAIDIWMSDDDKHYRFKVMLYGRLTERRE